MLTKQFWFKKLLLILYNLISTLILIYYITYNYNYNNYKCKFNHLIINEL